MDASLRKSNRIGIVAVIILNILDIVTTYWALSLGASEGNPLSSFLISSHLLIPSKILVVGAIVYAVLTDQDPTVRSNSMLWWVVGVYSLTILLNAIHLITLL